MDPEPNSGLQEETKDNKYTEDYIENNNDRIFHQTLSPLEHELVIELNKRMVNPIYHLSFSGKRTPAPQYPPRQGKGS